MRRAKIVATLGPATASAEVCLGVGHSGHGRRSIEPLPRRIMQIMWTPASGFGRPQKSQGEVWRFWSIFKDQKSDSGDSLQGQLN